MTVRPRFVELKDVLVSGSLFSLRSGDDLEAEARGLPGPGPDRHGMISIGDVEVFYYREGDRVRFDKAQINPVSDGQDYEISGRAIIRNPLGTKYPTILQFAEWLMRQHIAFAYFHERHHGDDVRALRIEASGAEVHFSCDEEGQLYSLATIWLPSANEGPLVLPLRGDVIDEA